MDPQCFCEFAVSTQRLEAKKLDESAVFLRIRDLRTTPESQIKTRWIRTRFAETRRFHTWCPASNIFVSCCPLFCSFFLSFMYVLLRLFKFFCVCLSVCFCPLLCRSVGRWVCLSGTILGARKLSWAHFGNAGVLQGSIVGAPGVPGAPFWG